MINDDFCLKLFLTENNEISMVNKINIFKKNPEVSKYLKNRFIDTNDETEAIYRIAYCIKENPKCYCGNKLKFNKKLKKYNTYCSYKCQNSDPQKIKKDKESKKERYGSENYNNIEKIKKTNKEKYGTEWVTQTKEYKEKTKETNKNKYGVEWCLQSKKIIEKSKKTKKEKYGSETYNNRDLAKKTCLERYGVDNAKQSEIAKLKEKETCLQKYGVTSYSKTEESKEKHRETFLKNFGTTHNTKSEEWKKKWYGNKEWSAKRSQKIYETMKKNGSFKESKTEKIIFEFLKTLYPDTIYQYKDEIRYPFKCDFYIPSLDVFIEYNGYWTHGKHPFNPESKEDVSILSKWKDKNTKHYKIAIRVWTIDDPLKRKYAKKYNLKYIELSFNDYKNLEKIKNKINECLYS